MPHEQQTFADIIKKKRIAKYRDVILGEILYAEELKGEKYFVIRIPQHLVNQEIIEQIQYPGNTIEFTGSGREILELMKKALCEFKNVYLINAFLHPHHGFADEGRALLNILIDIPDEKKWIAISYNHYESPMAAKGSGSISYDEHYYHRKPFPKEWIDRTEEKFTWGYRNLTSNQILDEVLERNKCRQRQYNIK